MTLFDKNVQDVMLARINKLSTTSQRKWGKMSVSQMLKHMTTAFAVPINKIQVPKDTLYYLSANPFARWMMIKVMTKWPKNLLPAPASFKVKDDPDFDNAKQELLTAFNEFIHADKFDGCHPVFGVMDKELWGDAMAIHLNHHLEQFGV
ncbi:MAG TPA: DUF1569 domain-containing protein [Chitinophagales bacterium]|nr:DUF1569 domain-containing protein [Chitinophagales bacterium]